MAVADSAAAFAEILPALDRQAGAGRIVVVGDDPAALARIAPRPRLSVMDAADPRLLSLIGRAEAFLCACPDAPRASPRPRAVGAHRPVPGDAGDRRLAPLHRRPGPPVRARRLGAGAGALWPPAARTAEGGGEGPGRPGAAPGAGADRRGVAAAAAAAPAPRRRAGRGRAADPLGADRHPPGRRHPAADPAGPGGARRNAPADRRHRLAGGGIAARPGPARRPRLRLRGRAARGGAGRRRAHAGRRRRGAQRLGDQRAGAPGGARPDRPGAGAGPGDLHRPARVREHRPDLSRRPARQDRALRRRDRVHLGPGGAPGALDEPRHARGRDADGHAQGRAAPGPCAPAQPGLPPRGRGVREPALAPLRRRLSAAVPPGSAGRRGGGRGDPVPGQAAPRRPLAGAPSRHGARDRESVRHRPAGPRLGAAHRAGADRGPRPGADHPLDRGGGRRARGAARGGDRL
ncbi:MAG: hypothetical protein WDM92_06080 [Caulobacteraceae bacterium]